MNPAHERARAESEPKKGDEVTILHTHGLTGVVSGVKDGEAMVCMPIAHRYQLRGPFPLSDLVLRARADQEEER